MTVARRRAKAASDADSQAEHAGIATAAVTAQTACVEEAPAAGAVEEGITITSGTR